MSTVAPTAAGGPQAAEAQRNRPASSASAVSKGLEGIVASDTSICKIDGQKGDLIYRGYSLFDLAEHSNFEEVAFLLCYGKMPTATEFKAFLRKWGNWRKVDPKVLEYVRKLSTPKSDPMDVLRTAVSLVGNWDPSPDTRDAAKLNEKGLAVAAKFPTLVAAHARAQKGKKPVQAAPSMRHGEAFLYMVRGEEPEPLEARAMDLDFLLTAEHEFNASTFACRLTASTLSDVYSALCSGIGTLKGPLHGGAREATQLQFKEIGGPDKVEGWIEHAFATKKKVMGWGHRVYKTTDPRAIVLKKMARQLSEAKGNSKWFDMAEKVEALVGAKPEFKEKRIFPNVDFWPPVVYNLLGITPKQGNAIFAIGRSVGWVAHFLEQRGDNRLIRPLGNYVGPENLPYVALENR